MKRGLVYVSPVFLEDWLQLPIGARVSRVFLDDRYSGGRIGIEIEGYGIENNNGSQLLAVEPICHSTQSMYVEWPDLRPEGG